MAKLDHRTRGDSRPQGKERVYFSCHPEDFDAYFDLICRDIFETQDCAIYYDAEPGEPWAQEAAEMVLGQMQLVVIPVTSRFLCLPNAARSFEFPFAQSHHIPVLPIMLEDDLNEPYREVCGDLQYLKRYPREDGSGIPYDRKLRRCLTSVLLGDEMAERIRGSFDAYLFLSYRKTDRREARELMREIHDIDGCRDLAIWYDEYLVPGEGFHQGIEDAMAKSELFTFVVTPHLLDEGNYAMTEEYPYAREKKKDIIPVEMVPTDRKRLQECFEGMPDVIPRGDTAALSAAFRGRLRALGVDKVNNDPRHLYLMGLAYLSGIDVEQNRERGVKLIKEATGALPEAMEKLSRMYENGEGVGRDPAAAAAWTEKLLAHRRERYHGSGMPEDGLRLVSALRDAGDDRKDSRQLEAARDLYGEMCRLAEQLTRTSDSTALRTDLAAGYDGLGYISKNESNWDEAKAWFRKGLEIWRQLRRGADSVAARIRAAADYNTVGEIWQLEGNLAEAKKSFAAAGDLLGQLPRETASDEGPRALSVSFKSLGGICQAEGDPVGARNWYEKALALYARMDREARTVKTRRELAAINCCLGDISRNEGQLADAKTKYRLSLEITENLDRETGAVQARRDLAVCMGRLGDICAKEGELPEAEGWYRKALAVEEALPSAYGNNTPGVRRDLSMAYLRLGDICRAGGQIPEAKSWYEKALEVDEALERENGPVQARAGLSAAYERMGTIFRDRENQAETKRWYEDILKIDGDLALEIETVEAQRDLSLIYHHLGQIREAEGDLTGAGSWYGKALKIHETLVRETGTARARVDLAAAYSHLGSLGGKQDLRSMRKAEEIWALLTDQFPDEPRYAENLRNIREQIKSGG